MSVIRQYLLFLKSFIVFYISLYILPETIDVAANTSTMSLDAILYNNQFLKVVKHKKTIPNIRKETRISSKSFHCIDLFEE